MAEKSNFDAGTFKQFEHDGWGEVSGTYHESFGKFTRQGAAPLLDAVGAEKGTRLLEVACGTGTVAAAAAERGAAAVGLDFVASMVEEARRLHPGVEYREGDAESLPYEDATLDGVVCNFGMRHFPNPERAMAEAFRVLVQGGWFAFTAWFPAEKSKESLHLVIKEAVQAHGDPTVNLPPSPPHDFSDAETSRRLLLSTGFSDPESNELPIVAFWEGPEKVAETIYKGMVRARVPLEAQSKAVRGKIDRAIAESASRFEKNGRIEIPMPALLNRAQKP